VEEGWSGRSTVAGARAAASTPFSGQTPVNSCSGRVGSARGRTVEAGVGFIAVGAGVGAGLMQHGATRAGLSAMACSSVARVREHVAVLICQSSCACRAPKHANLAICLV
jgi:hypothetical protein